MDVEPRLGQTFERSARGVQADVPDALREVRGKARRRTTRRRAAIAGCVAAVVLASGGIAWLGTHDPGDEPDPVDRPRGGDASLTVVRQRSAADLGLRGLLRVAVGPDGRVYVTDTSQQVAELGPDLELIRTFGGEGTGEGRLRLVQGSVAVGDDGRVYVADTGNFRVQVFSPRGEYLRSVGAYGTGPARFTWPFDVAVDDDGNIYVTDDKELTLTKLSPTGDQIWRRGGAGETDERLQGHGHLAMVDPAVAPSSRSTTPARWCWSTRRGPAWRA